MIHWVHMKPTIHIEHFGHEGEDLALDFLLAPMTN